MAASQHAFACRDGQWLARGISRRHVEGWRSYLPKPAGSKSRMGDLGGNAWPGARTTFGGAQRIRGEVGANRKQIARDLAPRRTRRARRKKLKCNFPIL